MNYFMIIFRLIHLFSAVTWVGTTYSMVLFIGPSALAVGAEAQKFMQYFTQRGRLVPVMMTVGGLTVLSGLTMYIYQFHGLAPLNTGRGLALTLGGLFGISALGIGILMARTIGRMRALSAEIATAGGPPKPEQLADMGKLQAALANYGATNGVLMSLALIGMTLSEYFVF